MRLLVALDDQTPDSVRFYRTIGPASFLEHQYGIKIDYIPARRFLTDKEMPLFPYTAILIERPITHDALFLARRAKSMGVIVWIDLDDNLFQIPDYNQAQDYFAQDRNIQTVQQTIQTADLVTVSTPHLKKIYSGLNENVHIVPNAWCDYRFPMPPVSEISDPVKIAWRGGNKHLGDLYDVRMTLAPLLQDMRFEWTFYGDRPHFLTINRKNYLPFASLFAYFQRFILSQLDFLFVPLVINDFNRSKSNCSWIEATLAGAVTIAPMGLPEFDQPGVIRYKDNTHLKKIFQDIKKGKYDKAERVEASRQALIENYRLSRVNVLRKQLLESFFPVAEKVEDNASA